MKQTRSARRREAAINSAKVALTSVSLAATLGGWAAISAMQSAELAASVAQAPIITEVSLPVATATSVPATVTISDAELSLSPTAPTSAATSTPAASTTALPTSTVAPTAVPTQVPAQPTVRSRSSR